MSESIQDFAPIVAAAITGAAASDYRQHEPDAESWRHAFEILLDKHHRLMRQANAIYDELAELEKFRDAIIEGVFQPKPDVLELRAQYRDEQRAKAAAERERASCVYYVRINDHIKIGTTFRLKHRMAAYHTGREALLAIEPGGPEREAQRHAQFAASRVGKTERFEVTPELMGHIDEARSTFGDPLNYL